MENNRDGGEAKDMISCQISISLAKGLVGSR